MLILNKCRKDTMAFLFPLKRDGGSGPYSAGRIGIAPHNDLVMFPLIHHQGIICGVAFDRSTDKYASLLKIRKPCIWRFLLCRPISDFLPVH